MGHWEGDAICPNSGADSKGKSKGKGKTKQSGARPREATNNGSHKKAFVVHCPGEHEAHDDEYQDETPATFHNFPTFVLNDGLQETYVTEVVDFGGYMIIDTACQRTCLGRKWLDVHSKILNKFGLHTWFVDDTDTFQFGAGPPQVSAQHSSQLHSQSRSAWVYCWEQVFWKMSTYRFLQANTLMEKLGVVIDLFNKQLHVHRLGISFPLEKKHRHLVAKIVCFPKDVKLDPIWKAVKKDAFWKKHDPEIVCPQSILAQSQISHRDQVRQPLDVAELPAPTRMASEVGGCW